MVSPSNKFVNKWECTRYEKYPSGIMIVPSGLRPLGTFIIPFVILPACPSCPCDSEFHAIAIVRQVQLKLLFTISVVRDHLLFMTKLSCTDDSVQKSLCGEGLPAEGDQ